MKNVAQILVCISLVLSGCGVFMTNEQLDAKRIAKAEKKAIDSAIVIHGEDMSPKWNELTRTIIPIRINRKASVILADNDPKKVTKYRLTVRYVNMTKDVTGSDSRGSSVTSYTTPIANFGLGIGGGKTNTKIKTLTTLESVATLAGVDGKTLWSWSGYSEDENDNNAVEKIGDKIAEELDKAGYLDAKKYISAEFVLQERQAVKPLPGSFGCFFRGAC